jgi:hypothetical protein
MMELSSSPGCDPPVFSFMGNDLRYTKTGSRYRNDEFSTYSRYGSEHGDFLWWKRPRLGEIPLRNAKVA